MSGHNVSKWLHGSISVIHYIYENNLVLHFFIGYHMFFLMLLSFVAPLNQPLAHVSIDQSEIEIEFEPTFSVVALSEDMEIEFIAVK